MASNAWSMSLEGFDCRMETPLEPEDVAHEVKLEVMTSLEESADE